jgi:hypothetical protein
MNSMGMCVLFGSIIGLIVGLFGLPLVSVFVISCVISVGLWLVHD